VPGQELAGSGGQGCQPDHAARALLRADCQQAQLAAPGHPLGSGAWVS